MLALPGITEESDFTKCLGEISMEDKVKKKFANTMDDICSDKELDEYYGFLEDLE